MIIKSVILICILIVISGFVQLYRVYFTIPSEATEGVVEIKYMSEPTLDLNNIQAEFNSSRMVTILCDGQAIGHEDGYTCTGEDGTKLCDGSPYKLLAFFDPPDGNLVIKDGETDYTCQGASSGSTVCYPETFNQWKRAHTGTEELTSCPDDESLYAPYGKCYFSKSQSGEALEYANEYIRLNDWKCTVP